MVEDSAALIIGYTIQGLAIARALSNAGIPVFVVERGLKDRGWLNAHPLVFTPYAKFLYYEKLIGTDLIETLVACRAQIPQRKVVIFPASDNTVRVLAEFWDQIEDKYLLSWSECRSEIARIIQKGALPDYCERAGVKYPKTALVRSESDFERVAAKLQFPVLVKPNKPASSFKTHICANESELRGFLSKEEANWPLVVQEWIDGPDDNLYSYTCLVEDQSEVFGMASRKVRASPPGLGRATVVETTEDDGVVEESRKLLKHFPIRGPVAMEFKKDSQGQYWFIESNVGRTEFCVDLAISAGFNLPLLEFLQALDRPITSVKNSITPAIWYDTDKEPFSYLSVCLKHMTFRPFGKKQIFPYWRNEGPRVLIAALLKGVRQYLRRAKRKLSRSFGRVLKSA